LGKPILKIRHLSVGSLRKSLQISPIDTDFLRGPKIKKKSARRLAAVTNKPAACAHQKQKIASMVEVLLWLGRDD
jgi:hypothetical protein